MRTADEHDPDVELALTLAKQASDLALEGRSTTLEARSKPDGTPVTAIDLDVERALVAALRSERPDDAIHGEEFGRQGESARVWLIDPIDGTAHFLSGRRDWGCHVALQIDGEVVLGVVTRPDDGHVFWARRGVGAFRQDLAGGHVARLAAATGATAQPPRVAFWGPGDDPLAERVRAVATLVDSDLNAILDVATGRLDAVIDVGGKPWDHAPFTILVEEAGGTFFDALGERRIDRGLVCYTTRAARWALVEAITQSVQDG